MKATLTVFSRTLLLVLAVICLGALVFFLPQTALFSELAENRRIEKGAEPMASVKRQQRGNIYDRSGREMAISIELTSIYARPLEIEDIPSAAQQLTTLLGGEERALASALKSERSFQWLGRDLDRDTADSVARLGLPGIHFVREGHRLYPGGERAAHILGFVNNDQGLEGVEFFYDQRLRGATKSETADALPAEHLLLTLDLQTQTLLSQKLEQQVEKSGASEGMAVALDVETGAVLGLASAPAYDPNKFWNFDRHSQTRRW